MSNKKELVKKYLITSDTAEALTSFIGQMWDQISGEESDFISKEQFEKTKAAVEKAKKQFADALPQLLAEVYEPAIEAAFTEQELEILIEWVGSDLYKKFQEFNKEFNVQNQIKMKPLFDKIMEDCFKDIF